jgi:hypothetical protein
MRITPQMHVFRQPPGALKGRKMVQASFPFV